MRRYLRVFAFVLVASPLATTAWAQRVVSLRAGESADLHGVYWIANCQSLLDRIAGVDLLEGPPGVRLNIREEEVVARRQNCPNKVPGGTVVLTADSVPEKVSGVVRYRVRYETREGSKQSNHSVQVELFPLK